MLKQWRETEPFHGLPNYEQGKYLELRVSDVGHTVQQTCQWILQAVYTFNYMVKKWSGLSPWDTIMFDSDLTITPLTHNSVVRSLANLINLKTITQMWYISHFSCIRSVQLPLFLSNWTSFLIAQYELIST